MKPSGNTILITGGTSGIGYALAKQLLARGNTVAITGRTPERLAETARSLPGVHTFVCDQGDAEAIARTCTEVIAALPALNVLINNAGIGLKRNLHEAGGGRAGDLGQEIRTNLTGPILLIDGLLALLRRQQAATIVNVTSGLAFAPLALKPIYCATKAAMHSYTQSLRAQLANTAVRVVELAPPAVATEFNRGQEEMNAGPRMDADTLARLAIRGLEQGRDEILPGMSPVLRLVSRLNPKAVLRRADAARMGQPG